MFPFVACAWKCCFRAVGYMGQILHLEISKWPKIIISLDTRPTTSPLLGLHQSNLSKTNHKSIYSSLMDQFTNQQSIYIEIATSQSVSPRMQSVLAKSSAEWFWPRHRLGGRFPSAKFTFYDRPSSFQAQALICQTSKIDHDFRSNSVSTY